MKTPDQRAFEIDLAGADFLIGAQKGMWGVVEESVQPADLIWPYVALWVAAASRTGSPDRFHLRLNLDQYRHASPTGSFWDFGENVLLPLTQWPKGRAGSRVDKVFRTDWNDRTAFYHPYDRVAANSHPAWKQQQPHLIWDSEHTIVDYLDEIYRLLTSKDYIGV